ncbi:hypothetical protein N7488_003532 [Penicillium malachiteum]|nr:hypothetical protein N7488_003532 [Penicillium malachiteum]
MKLLLESGADANAIGSKGGYTPLHHGSAPWCHEQSVKVVKLLIDHGADVTKGINGPINDQWTPLHLATCRGFEEIVRVLLEKGAEVNGKTKREHGADPSLEDKNGQTPLQVAAANGDEEMVKFLLKYRGLESDAKKWTQQAQFYNAVREGDAATVRVLLESRIDMKMKSVREEYLLHWAMHRGHQRVASLLLEKGADINATDKFGETALMLACKTRNEEMMQFLLDNGADINIKNDERAGGDTVLSFATSAGESQIVEMLLKRGASSLSVKFELPLQFQVKTHGRERSPKSESL